MAEKSFKKRTVELIIIVAGIAVFTLFILPLCGFNKVDIVGELGCRQIMFAYGVSGSSDRLLANYINNRLREYYPDEHFDVSPSEAMAAVRECTR